MTWINIKEEKPKNCKNVLVFYETENRVPVVLIAAYFGQYELEAASDAFGDDLEYSDDTDEYFAPAGWYEYSEHNGDYCYIYFSGINITHWMEIPFPKKDNE